MWTLPCPGIKPTSSALAGGFLSTRLPGKYLVYFLFSVVHPSPCRVESMRLIQWIQIEPHLFLQRIKINGFPFFEIYISQTSTCKIILYVALGVKKTYKIQVQSLGHGDPLDEGMKTHSSILAWRNPWTKEPGRLWSIASQRVDHDWSDLAH